MKNSTKLSLILAGLVTSSLLTSCSLLFPSNAVMTNYKLDAVSLKRFATRPSKPSLLVNQPTAAAGYQDNSMQYMQQNYQIASFAKNQWLAPPAQMLQPLIVQSIRNTGYFYTVAAAPISGTTTLRLDTQLVKLQQNFIKRPSEVELVVQAVLVNSRNNTVIASQRFTAQVAAPYESPYGGVIAANIACQQVMQQIATFVVKKA